MAAFPFRPAPVLAQGVFVAAGLAWLTMAPPVRGFVLLVPLTPQARPVHAALLQNMRLVGTGPLTSIVVRADDRVDAAALLRAGVLALAAPASSCGTAA